MKMLPNNTTAPAVTKIGNYTDRLQVPITLAINLSMELVISQNLSLKFATKQPSIQF